MALRRALAFATAGLLLALALDRPARAGWWDDLDKGQSVGLGDLIAQPDRYRTGLVSFFCIFHRRDQVFNPIATPFHPARYANVAVWADGAAVWDQDTYAHDFPFLYMDQQNPQHDALTSLEAFTRIEVTGRVRSILRSIPQIEVVSFRPTSQRVGGYVVQSVMAGDRHAEAGDLDLAYENYRRALTPDLPPAYEMLVKKRVAEALRRLGRGDEADRMDGGGIVASSGAPETRPVVPGGSGGLLGDPLPGPAGPPPGLGGPVAVAPPPSAAGAPAGTPPGPGQPGAPPGVITSDLPGQPVGAGPLTTDLPGTPVGAPSPPRAAPPARPASGAGPASPARGAPPKPRTDDLPGTPDDEAEAPTPPPPVPAGAPRRHAPRLTGVK